MNRDADGLSRIPLNTIENFPEVIQTISQSVFATTEGFAFAESVILRDEPTLEPRDVELGSSQNFQQY